MTKRIHKQVYDLALKQGEYLNTCFKGCVSNMTVVETDLDTKDVSITWVCLECDQQWTEHYAFRYWEVKND